MTQDELPCRIQSV